MSKLFIVSLFAVMPVASQATLPKDAIRAGVRQVIPALTACYEAAAPTLPDGPLHIHAHFTVTGVPQRGSVVAVQPLFDDDNHALPAALDSCLRDALAKMALPRLDDGARVQVNYPFAFWMTAPTSKPGER